MTGRSVRLRRAWYTFSRNKLSVVGLVVVTIMVILAVVGPYLAPYPEHAGPFVDFKNASQPPSAQHWFGTDTVGRDLFSRCLFGLRSALMMGVIVLSIVVPIGTSVGLVAGYMRGTLVEVVLMRITDIFLAVPSLVLAMAIAAVLEPTLRNVMLAISVTWWTWYARLAYNLSISLRNDYFVKAAELTGAGVGHIFLREMLPNCLAPILTKVTLDMAWVIMTGASLGFVGLGEQPPIPALGSMVSEGGKYLPDFWWMTIFPAVMIMLCALPFNLLGDGVRDLLTLGEEK